MAQYQIGSQPHYRRGRLYPAGSKITLPTDVQPSRTWKPLDDEARKAHAALLKADAEREKLRAVNMQAVSPAELPALIESLVSRRVDAALAAVKASASPPPPKGSGKPDGKPDGTKGGRTSDQSPV